MMENIESTCPLCNRRIQVLHYIEDKAPYHVKCDYCKIDIGGPSIVSALKEFEEFAFFMRGQKKTSLSQRHQYHYTMNFNFQI